MTSVAAGSPVVHGYHAHVYYDNDSFPVATKLRDALEANFPVEIGAFSGEQVGPHPVPQFQVIFKTDAFQTVVPWLMLHREGLDILVHPLTDDMLDDEHGVRGVARRPDHVEAGHHAASRLPRGPAAEGLTASARAGRRTGAA